jgi:hypothetical protein
MSEHSKQQLFELSTLPLRQLNGQSSEQNVSSALQNLRMCVPFYVTKSAPFTYCCWFNGIGSYGSPWLSTMCSRNVICMQNRWHFDDFSCRPNLAQNTNFVCTVKILAKNQIVINIVPLQTTWYTYLIKSFKCGWYCKQSNGIIKNSNNPECVANAILLCSSGVRIFVSIWSQI